MDRPARLAVLGLAVLLFAVVWAVSSFANLYAEASPVGSRFDPDDREWWSVPFAFAGLAVVAYAVLRREA